MTVTAIFRYSLPALLVGALGGYFVGDVLGKRPASSARKTSTLRDDFLSTTDDEIDYEKVARVCLAAASRTPRQTTAKASVMAEPNSPEVTKAKERLDGVMSRSMEVGVWSRGAGMLAEGLLQRMPPADVADFETLLRTTVERGDLEVQPGAWVPEDLN
jgi:hypothetical protein